MRLILTLVLMVALSACSIGQRSPTATPTSRPGPSPSAPESSPSVQPDASATKACAEVRAGIDAFNSGDFETTVEHFRLAVPLARTQARSDPSPSADDLVAAVTYYAELAPADYPESAHSSSEFAQNKEITLGQCVTGTNPLEESTQPPSTTT